MDTLIDVLRQDAVEEESAPGLVTLATNLMKQLDRDLTQRNTIKIQTKISTAYAVLMDLILRHYAAKHNGAVTAELKAQLLKTSKDLGALNTQDDPDLTQAVSLASEGIKRIQDDNNAMMEAVRRVGSAIDAVAKAYNKDVGGALNSLIEACKGLGDKIKLPWFGRAYALGGLFKLVQKDPKQLEKLHAFYEKHQDDHRIAYLYIDFLASLVQNGPDSIRQEAYKKLLTFKNCHQFSKELSLIDPIARFSKPKLFDMNLVITRRVYQHLIMLAEKGPNATIRIAARQELIAQWNSQNEQQKGVKDHALDVVNDWIKLLKPAIPQGADERKAWLADSSPLSHKVPSSPVQQAHQVKTLAPQNVAASPFQPVRRPPPTPMPHGSLAPAFVAPVQVPSQHKPEEMIIRLARCLGVTTDWLEHQRITSKGISLRNSHGLCIASEGIAQVLKLTQASTQTGPAITTLDLTGVELYVSETDVLAKGLINSPVTKLILDTQFLLKAPISEEAACEAMKPFAEAIRERSIQKLSDLTIVCNSRKGYSCLGFGLKTFTLLSKAETYYKLGIQLGLPDAESDLLHTRLGKVYFMLDQLDLAWKQAEEALKLNPSYCPALELQASIHQKKGKYLESKKLAYEVYELEPLDLDHIYNLAAKISTKSDSWDELRYALKLITELCVKQPDDSNIKLKAKIENALLLETK